MEINIEALLDDVTSSTGKKLKFFSLKKLSHYGFTVDHLPYSIRIILESALRNFDGKLVTGEHILSLLNWKSCCVSRCKEVPFVVSRVILQDYTGVPLLSDLSAMREFAVYKGLNPDCIEPTVPVDLVIDHSVSTNYTVESNAISLNMELEFNLNEERYAFMKWGSESFRNFNVFPPGSGIIHQINLEFLSKGVIEKDGVYSPDTVIGADSHTTMINGLGIVGFGVGGIEAESAMLGLPVYILEPDIIGVNIIGRTKPGVTSTDMVLTLTEQLRAENVIGKVVEFFGNGVRNLSVQDRATISNMAPDYGATMGLFCVDQKTLDYYAETGRDAEDIENISTYYKSQDLFDIDHSRIDYTKIVTFDLSLIVPCVSGPTRPQDRIPLQDIRSEFNTFLAKNNQNNKADQLEPILVSNGDILVAAIASCTNTSNPNAMITAGVLAKKAVENGLTINRNIKRSISPGSRVVAAYLESSGLQFYLDQLGFRIVGYGCATCIGNVGDLDPEIEEYIKRNNIIACSVLSGNRNFEARIHQSLKANFLMSPALVVACAISGNIRKIEEPFASNPGVSLCDIWPTEEEINEYMTFANNPKLYISAYSDSKNELFKRWNNIDSPSKELYRYDEHSTYIKNPPYFENFTLELNETQLSDIHSARILVILGDSVTTDHISPAGAIIQESPAGKYLRDKGVRINELNTFGARRGNHEVMTRGVFCNRRIKNRMLDGIEGGMTIDFLKSETTSIYEAATNYKENNIPTVVFAGKEYGTGSARDWAAKGMYFLGVKVVIAESFERIHKSNLIGMGILPCQLDDGFTCESVGLQGNEVMDILNIRNAIEYHEKINLIIYKPDGVMHSINLICRLDTAAEKAYYKNGGILHYIARRILKSQHIS